MGTKLLFQHLKHLEITCNSFPKACFSFIISHAFNLKTIKAFHVPGVRQSDLEDWCLKSKCLQKLETLILFKAPEITKDAVDMLLDSLPALQRLGDFHSFDVRKPHDLRRFQSKIRDEGWNLTLVDSTQPHPDEKDFNRLLSLHWFYLTNENPALKSNSNH